MYMVIFCGLKMRFEKPLSQRDKNDIILSVCGKMILKIEEGTESIMNQENTRRDSLSVTLENTGQEISATTYNAIIGGMLVYGLGVSFFLGSVATGFAMSINPIAFLIGYIVCAIAGIFIAHRGGTVAAFIGYNLIVLPLGVMLSLVLPAYGAQDVNTAILVTWVISIVMMGASMAFPKFFSRLGSALFISLICLIVADIVCGLFLHQAVTAVNMIACGIFALYIGYDWYLAFNQRRTAKNAILSALNLFLDIINLFLRILEIVGRRD